MSEISPAPTGAQHVGNIMSYGSAEERVYIHVNTESGVNTVTVNDEKLDVTGIPGADEDRQVLAALVEARTELRNRNTESTGLYNTSIALSVSGGFGMLAALYTSARQRSLSKMTGATPESIDALKDITVIAGAGSLTAFSTAAVCLCLGILRDKVRISDKEAKIAKVDSALQTHINI